MKQYFSFFSLLLLSTALSAQDLTGIWRGSFYNVKDMMFGNGGKSRYEVQIDDSKKPVGGKKGVEGVTFSYQTTRFYGKASLRGIWDPESKNLIFEENKLLEYKFSDGDGIYLFTCILDYKKVDGREILEGSYTSKHFKTGREGGGGKVYLEKVPDSDFEKEDFLIKKEKSLKGKVKPGLEDIVVEKPQNKPLVIDTPTEKPKIPITPKPTNPPVTVRKPVTPTIKKPVTPTVKRPVAPPVASPKPVDSTAISNEIPPKNNPAPVVIAKPAPPAVLKQRTNELFQTINTNSREITISFYDNGEIDGDTISVYDNNKLITKGRGLSAQPITIKVNLDETEPEHDIVMVAENLGSIPPNTALMIVQAGDDRYNVRLSSTEKKNALVKIKFTPRE